MLKMSFRRDFGCGIRKAYVLYGLSHHNKIAHIVSESPGNQQTCFCSKPWFRCKSLWQKAFKPSWEILAFKQLATLFSLFPIISF